jgi:hypothetical protein
MSWQMILKEWTPKRIPPKPKQIDQILEYLKINPKRTMKQITRDLNLYMTTRRLRKLLDETPDIETAGKYPTTYRLKERLK